MHSSGCATFAYDLRRLEMLVAHEPRTADELTSLLTAIYDHVFAVDFARYDLASLTASAPDALDDFYDLRLALRDRIPGWRDAGLIGPDAERRLRDCFRALRYATDLIGELHNGFANRRPGASRRVAFKSETLFHPALRGETRHAFRSGDILLVRGTLHNSAAIARIGDVDSQFSHAGIVYVDRRERQFVVEALIEEGATWAPLSKVLGHDLGRAVVFRHPDAQLAAAAAEHIYRHVRRSRGLFGRHIPYDFSMELDGTSALFCSKLVRMAFAEASGGHCVMPAFPTRFDQAASGFLDAIGVTARQTFAPGDLELEPDVSAIAEWRDLERTSALRLQDFVMVKLFEWMEQEGYVFRETPWIRLLSTVGRATAYLPWPLKSLVASLAPKIPTNMKREAVAAIAMLHYTAQPLFEKLQKLERESIAERGYPLHPREILTHLENIRRDRPVRVGYLVPDQETRATAPTPRTA